MTRLAAIRIRKLPNITTPTQFTTLNATNSFRRYQSNSSSSKVGPSPSSSPERLTEQVKPDVSFPKHVWSPAGGWNTQPANWKSNTAICAVIMFGIMTIVWDFSSKREIRVNHVEVDRKKWRMEQRVKKEEEEQAQQQQQQQQQH